MLHYAASDLGLHCMHIFYYKEEMLILYILAFNSRYIILDIERPVMSPWLTDGGQLLAVNFFFFRNAGMSPIK